MKKEDAKIEVVDSIKIIDDKNKVLLHTRGTPQKDRFEELNDRSK